MSEPSADNIWQRLNNLALVRFLLMFTSGWALVTLLAYFEAVIVIFTFAAILAFLLSYPVRWLRRFLPHSVAVIFVLLTKYCVSWGHYNNRRFSSCISRTTIN
jgi:predicted PurR-regulated permease PerM